MRDDVINAARRLAEHNASAEPNIMEVLLFPSEDEIRLVEVDPTCMPNEDIVSPYYYAPDNVEGIPFRFGIAMILPEEKGKIALPSRWGSWNDAVSIWRRGR